MAHNYPYRYGDTEPRNIAAAADIQVYGGDLCQVSSGLLEPANEVLNANIANFVAGFAGVAFSDSDNIARSKNGLGETHEIAVGTTGVYEFEIAALGAAADVGDFIGPVAGTTHLNPKAVAVVTLAAEAIGYVAEAAPVGATSIKVQIVSQMFGNALV